jgi:hypothetical protein
VSDVEYVKLETRKACLYSWANYSVGRKYILAVQQYNPAQIFLFNRSGKFIRKIGGEGNGPLEFSSLSNVVADPEETYILVNDSRKSMFLKYDLDGNLLKRFNYAKILNGDIGGILIRNSNEIWIRLQYPILEKKNFYLIRKLDGDFNQMDSLYPVTNKVSPGGGFSSGLSDFYLSADVLQFRQFSTDTLYSVLKGKLVPRFLLPIKSNHLPGPYIIRGLHKTMQEYSDVGSISEFTDYMMFTTRNISGKGGIMIFNKSSGEISRLKKFQDCTTELLPEQMFINDIDGIVNPRYLDGKSGLIVEVHEIINLKDWVKNNCMDKSAIRFPDKQKVLIDLINSSSPEDNPILQIFHLAKWQ